MGSGSVFFVQRHMARSAPAIIVTTLALTNIILHSARYFTTLHLIGALAFSSLLVQQCLCVDWMKRLRRSWTYNRDIYSF